MSKSCSMPFEFENVGGAQKIKSYLCVSSSRNSCTSERTRWCLLRCSRLRSKFSLAQSRYVFDRSTLVDERAPPAAAYTVAEPVYENRFKNDLPAASC